MTLGKTKYDVNLIKTGFLKIVRNMYEIEPLKTKLTYPDNAVRDQIPPAFTVYT